VGVADLLLQSRLEPRGCLDLNFKVVRFAQVSEVTLNRNPIHMKAPKIVV